MTKNMKKVVRRIQAGITCTDETHPINYEKAVKRLINDPKMPQYEFTKDPDYFEQKPLKEDKND